MVRKINFGYVGCGFLAQAVHIPNFKAIDGCDFHALAEVRAGLGKKVAEKYRIPRLYKSHRELADDRDVEAVGISGPFHVQGEIAKDMLNAGKHVFVEKPMAVTSAQAKGIIDASRKTGARIMVAYMKRYDAGNELAKGCIDRFKGSGELGRIIYCRNHGFCGDWTAGLAATIEKTDEPLPQYPQPPIPDWLTSIEYEKYVGFLQQYIHNINLMRWFLDAGQDVRVRIVDLDDDGYTGITVMKMGGTRVVFETGSIGYHAWDEHTQIYFERGWIKAHSPPLLLRNATADVEVYAGSKEGHEYRFPSPKERWTWSYLREAQHFIQSVAEDKGFRSPGEDAIVDIKVVEDLFRIFLQK